MASRSEVEYAEEPLYVVIIHFNPGRFQRRDTLTAEFIERLLHVPRAVPIVIECVVGRDSHLHAIHTMHGHGHGHGRDRHSTSSLTMAVRMSDPGVSAGSGVGAYIHIPVRVNTTLWVKECLFNLAVTHLTRTYPDWKYVAQPDADLVFLNTHWVRDTIDALQLFPVAQMFETSMDMGPSGRAGRITKSFAAALADGVKTDVASASSTLVGHATRVKGLSKALTYGDSHPGYAWAYTRAWLARVGGLFEVAILGSADTIMTRAMVGAVDQALSSDMHPSYIAAAHAWQDRVAVFGGRVGFVRGTVAHSHHGPKVNRLYAKRTRVLVDHQYDPVRDTVKNEYGVIELAGNKPILESAIHAYFSIRSEDDITP